jgi:hypothetical protein
MKARQDRPFSDISFFAGKLPFFVLSASLRAPTRLCAEFPIRGKKRAETVTNVTASAPGKYRATFAYSALTAFTM